MVPRVGLQIYTRHLMEKSHGQKNLLFYMSDCIYKLISILTLLLAVVWEQTKPAVKPTSSLSHIQFYK